MPRRHRSRPAARLCALAVLATLAFSGSPAGGDTACYTDTCGGTCTPGGTVAISTLVAPGDFPAGMDNPTAFVDPADNRGRRFIAVQEGAILVWDAATQSVLPTPFLDLRSVTGGPVACCGERGLLSLAVEPDYATTGRLYVFYTRDSDGPGPGSEGAIVVERYQRSAGSPDVADPTPTTILVLDHPAGNHNGGWLAFGPDGFLYVSTGDGGGRCDGNLGTSGDGQRTDTLHGKILRIDVRSIDGSATAPDDCSVAAGAYAVPSTNPLSGQEPACDEVWALGLRNPFRFSFDRQTGDLYVGDVGQNKWEEINLQRAATPAPVNFGWVCREGCETAYNNPSFCSTTGCPVDTGTTCEFPRTAGHWDPILCHSNPNGWKSIMGGYRYRGSHVPSIAGDYLYSDAACGQIWKTDTLDPANPAAITASCWASGFGGTYGFAEDRLGELYVVRGGANRIDCIHDGDGCFWANPLIFTDGFESGDVLRWSAAVP